MYCTAATDGAATGEGDCLFEQNQVTAYGTYWQAVRGPSKRAIPEYKLKRLAVVKKVCILMDDVSYLFFWRKLRGEYN